ncbi:MaoC family dehydratase N-terminal domain-containing protein [Chloroflexota bacterium]
MVEHSAITDEMRKTIGARLPDFSPEVADIWGILRYVAATEDPNPLWRDEECAKQSRWGGIIAPPTFVEVFCPANRGTREQGVGAIPDMPFKTPFERRQAAGEDMKFFAPIRPGDAISCVGKLGDIWEKQSSAGKTMVFARLDKEYHNQNNELVAQTSYTSMFTEAGPPASSTPPPPRPPAPEREVSLATVSPTQVYFEDVEVGNSIPPMEKRVIMTTIAQWAGATGAVHYLHFDYELVRKVYGLPNVLAHGTLNTAYLAQLVTNWIGSWGALKKHSVQYRGNVFPGDIVTFNGKVSSKYILQGEKFVECETWAENQNAVKVTLGKSVVTLPAREN